MLKHSVRLSSITGMLLFIERMNKIKWQAANAVCHLFVYDLCEALAVDFRFLS